MPKEKVLLFFANTKYSVHIHAYVNKAGFVCVRKRDTSMPDYYDHVDVLEPKVIKKHVDFTEIDDNSYTLVTRFFTRGKSHTNENMREKIINALNDLLCKAKLPYEYTQGNLKKLYQLGVR